MKNAYQINTTILNKISPLQHVTLCKRLMWEPFPPIPTIVTKIWPCTPAFTCFCVYMCVTVHVCVRMFVCVCVCVCVCMDKNSLCMCVRKHLTRKCTVYLQPRCQFVLVFPPPTPSPPNSPSRGRTALEMKSC